LGIQLAIINIKNQKMITRKFEKMEYSDTCSQVGWRNVVSNYEEWRREPGWIDENNCFKVAINFP